MKLYFPLGYIGHSDNIRITQYFGEHLNDYSPMLGHNGIDFSAPLGTPILACHDGYIIESIFKDPVKGYGLRVSQFFGDDGFQWVMTYAHQQKSAFPDIVWDFNKRNVPVKAGDILGFVDSTGFSTGNHLHITLQKYSNGQLLNSSNGYGGAVDPMPYLKGNSMRLVKDTNTVYLVAGVGKKVKIGIADAESLALFGDEPIVEENTFSIPETTTLTRGFVIHNK